MRKSWIFAALICGPSAALALAGRPVPGQDGSGWYSKQFKNFIVFGDSYSDENRLNYFGQHNGTLPPPGTVLPENLATASGGRIWARYVVQYTGRTISNGSWQPQLSGFYDYAVGGAVCSNNVTPRTYTAVHKNFPDLARDELATFLADKQAISPATGKPTFPAGLPASSTLYVVWTGGNDLGADAFFTDSQVPGNSIVNYLNCIYELVDQLYAQGGRYFVLPNNPPFDLAPLYANASEGGIGTQEALNYWPTGKGTNLTAIAEKMREFVLLTNDAQAHRIPYDSLIAKRWPGAKLAHFDIWRLFMNIHQKPQQYLNGTHTPYNTTAYASKACQVVKGVCSDRGCCDSFMWYDSLHKSEQTDRIIAREFVNVMSGNSTYATYWHS